jgi:hypothetical protein
MCTDAFGTAIEQGLGETMTGLLGGGKKAAENVERK